MKKQELDALGELIGAIFGGKVEVETIIVPEGKTIQEAVAEHEAGQPCDICGEVHSPSDPNEPVESKQVKAIAAIDSRINRLTLAIERLRELQASIAQPYDGRDGMTLLKEILLAKEIERLTA